MVAVWSGGQVLGRAVATAAICMLVASCAEDALDTPDARDREPAASLPSEALRVWGQGAMPGADQILYVRDEVGLTWNAAVHFDIWLMDADGGNARNLTARPGRDMHEFMETGATLGATR